MAGAIVMIVVLVSVIVLNVHIDVTFLSHPWAGMLDFEPFRTHIHRQRLELSQLLVFQVAPSA